MKFDNFRNSLLALAASAGSATAFWRLTCDHPIVVERGDPIVNPGKISGHLHQVTGGSNFNFTMTYADARKSACSSCKIKQDLSNYWYGCSRVLEKREAVLTYACRTPVLFYQYPNGTFTQVKQLSTTIYYM